MTDIAFPQDRRFNGLWAPVLTPLDRTFAPDHAAFVDHCKFLLANGCHGLAPFGTTGEANSFSVAERMNAVDAVVEAGIEPDLLIPGTGCCAGPDTVELTKQAVSLGCRGVLMLPPFYYKNPSSEGLYRAFAGVIDRVGDNRLKVLLYHIPKMSQIPVPHDVIARLCDAYPGVIAGIKDSSGDWSQTEAFIRSFPELDVFPGSEVFALQGLRAGGVGCISATANVNPSGIRAIIDAFISGDGSADRLQEDATALRRKFENFPVIPAMKRLIAERLGKPEWSQSRPPFVPLDDDAWLQLDADVGQLDLAA